LLTGRSAQVLLPLQRTEADYKKMAREGQPQFGRI